MNFRSPQIEMSGPVAIVTLSRPERRNAIDESTVEEIGRFSNVPRKKRGSRCSRVRASTSAQDWI